MATSLVSNLCAVSVGDPAGVGPEVSLRAAARCGSCVLFGDASYLERRALALGITTTRRIDAPVELSSGEIGLVHVSDWTDAVVSARRPTGDGGRATLAAIDAACGWVENGRSAGLVTAPASKAAVALVAPGFRGHTEYLARRARLKDDDVTMLFLGERLRVATVTTHLAVKDVPAAVTRGRVRRTILHLAEALERLIDQPEITVAGLNPHAGEGGLLGTEEIDVVQPALDEARAELSARNSRVRLRPNVIGAETALREACGNAASGVVVMMHDQATIASKVADWGETANVTWGLPWIRTSPDHGVGYEAAGGSHVSADGMIAAVRMAQRLIEGRGFP